MKQCNGAFLYKRHHRYPFSSFLKNLADECAISWTQPCQPIRYVPRYDLATRIEVRRNSGTHLGQNWRWGQGPRGVRGCQHYCDSRASLPTRTVLQFLSRSLRFPWPIKETLSFMACRTYPQGRGGARLPNLVGTCMVIGFRGAGMMHFRNHPIPIHPEACYQNQQIRI